MRRNNQKQLVSTTIFTRTIVGTARAAGADAERYLQQLGSQRALLEDPEAWLPGEVVEDFLAQIGEDFDHPSPGIWVAEHVSPDAGDVLGYAMRTSACLGDAYETAARYYGLVGTGIEVYYRVIEGRGRFTHVVPTEAAKSRRHRDELVLGSLVALGRAITGTHIMPEYVTFQHKAPSDVSHHEKLFGNRVSFEEPATEIALLDSVLDRPCVWADETLNDILDRYATSLVEANLDHPMFVQQVRSAIFKSLPAGDTSLSSTAQAMSLSPRTLQRKLRELGTSHKELLKQTRHYLAEQYLRSPQLSIDEVSFLLGYANTPAFTRAFKGWTGLPPTEYRSREIGANG